MWHPVRQTGSRQSGPARRPEMKIPFTPMLLERAEKPFADPMWLYQIKWDGVRNLTLVEGGRVRHWSRRLRDRTRLFPELDGLHHALGGARAVLDGEIIVLRKGKPSFAGVLERDVGTRPPDPAKLRQAPATLMLFDLLEHGEVPLYDLPLHERLHLLRRLIPDTDHWQVTTGFPGEMGPHLFQATLQQGLEGIVAKRLESRYRPGIRTPHWVKLKHKRRMTALVCGYTAPVGGSGGLILGAFFGDRLVYIGRAGSGIRSDQWSVLRAELRPGPCPFDRMPTLRDRFSGPPGPVVWTVPSLTVLVEFTDWTEEQRLRDPVVIRFGAGSPADARLE